MPLFNDQEEWRAETQAPLLPLAEPLTWIPLVLFILAGLATIFGFGILSVAKSAVHEIEAFALFLIAAVLVSAAVIVHSVNEFRRDVRIIATRGEGVSIPQATPATPATLDQGSVAPPKFRTREEYERWKAEKLRQDQKDF